LHFSLNQIMLNILEKFEPVGLIEMDSVKLMDRFDAKYCVSLAQLSLIVNWLQREHKLLEIDGKRLMTYHTDYFDTQNFDMFYNHHNGVPIRKKVRIRTYVDSGDCFLEIKKKNARKQTKKNRILIPENKLDASDEVLQFLKKYSDYGIEFLSAKIHNQFNRCTFVSFSTQERITIDTNLRFVAGNDITINHLAIVELKSGTKSVYSPFAMFLKSIGCQPNGFSKYCIGLSLVQSGLKTNNFKEKILLINKLKHEFTSSYRTF